MIRFLFAIGAVSLCINEPSFAQDGAPWDNSAKGSTSEIIAFVGQPLFVEGGIVFETVEEQLLDGRIVTRQVATLNERYEARFIIETVLGDEYKNLTIDFAVVGHAINPNYTKSRPSLLFVARRGNKWASMSPFYYDVQRTTDGDWATCGDPYEDYKARNPDASYAAETISFSEPFEYYNGYKGSVICEEGARVRDLYAFIDQTQFLPVRRREICSARYSVELEALGNDYKSKRIIIDDCVSLLKTQTLP